MRFLILAAVSAIVLSFPIPAGEPEVKIGAQVGDLKFKDTRYLARSLRDFGEKKAFVLIFVDTGCPLVANYLPGLQRMERTYRDQGVQFIGVNCGTGDTIAAMAAHAVDHGIEFPFVKDLDFKVADAVGATRTPECVVLDSKRVLRYRGRIDDQYRPGGRRAEPTRRDLALAIDAVLARKDVEEPSTPVDGCLITRPAADKDAAPTFGGHVAPILAKHCQSCHKPGTAAPFALLTYEQAQSRGRTIGEVVAEGRMPPWFTTPREGDLIQHHNLSAAERETIGRWVRTGMARGRDVSTPAPAEAAPAKWQIGEPDLVVSTTTFDIPAEGDVAYKYAMLPHLFAEDTWVQAVQIRPELPKNVHHANLVHVKLGQTFKESNFITGVVPGGVPMSLDNGVAYLIPKGSILALQIHFITTGTPRRCKIDVGLKYAGGTIDQRLHHLLFVDTRYTIPPGAPSHAVKVERTLDCDAQGIGLFAHMHVRGKAMTFTAQPPGGERERLLTIGNYNFEWQIPYRWEPGKKILKKGTKLECVALYDNSPFNPFNPDATKPVKDGPQTYHEMLNGFMFYIDANEKLGLTIDPKTGRPK